MFVAALGKVLGPHPRVGADAGKPVKDFPEPVGEVTRSYPKQVSIETAAAEMGVAKAEVPAGPVRGDPALKELGVLALANGKTLERDDREAVDVTPSLSQDVALALRIGTPTLTR